MTFFDFVVVALVGASVVAGALRGLVRAALVGAALVIGVIVAARGYELIGRFVRGFELVESVAAANVAGFLLIVGVALVAGFAAGRLFRGGLRRAHLEWFDYALGGAFGFVRGVAFCSVIFLALTAFPVRIDSVAEARTAPILAEGARLLTACTSPELRARFISEYRRLTA